MCKEDSDSRTSISCSKNKSEVSASYSVSGFELHVGNFLWIQLSIMFSSCMLNIEIYEWC